MGALRHPPTTLPRPVCVCGTTLAILSVKAGRHGRWVKQKVACYRCGLRGTRWAPMTRNERDRHDSTITAVLVPEEEA